MVASVVDALSLSLAELSVVESLALVVVELSVVELSVVEPLDDDDEASDDELPESLSDEVELDDDDDDDDDELVDALVDDVEPPLAVALVPASSPEQAESPKRARESSEEAKNKRCIPPT